MIIQLTCKAISNEIDLYRAGLFSIEQVEAKFDFFLDYLNKIKEKIKEKKEKDERR